MLALALAAGLLGLMTLRLPGVMRILRTLLDKLGAAWPRVSNLTRRLGFFFEAWHRYLFRPATLAASIAVGIAFQALNAIVLWLIGAVLGLGLPFAEWSWVLTLVSLAVVLPLTIGGIGIREGAFVGVLGVLGIRDDLALSVSLIVFGLQLLGAALGAILEVVGVRRPA
jgi:uncharacterized membrane protein YbhN (UPF0104 family)